MYKNHKSINVTLGSVIISMFHWYFCDFYTILSLGLFFLGELALYLSCTRVLFLFLPHDNIEVIMRHYYFIRYVFFVSAYTLLGRFLFSRFPVQSLIFTPNPCFLRWYPILPRVLRTVPRMVCGMTLHGSYIYFYWWFVYIISAFSLIFLCNLYSILLYYDLS